MVSYRYKAMEPGKSPIDITIEADSEADSLSRLRSRGLIPIKAYGEAGAEKHSFRLKRKDLDACEFSDRLMPLLDANIPLEKCLAIIEQSVPEGSSRDVVRSMRRGLHEGKKFSELVRSQPQRFPAIYASLVETGEETGCLPETIRELRRFLNESRSLKEFIVTSSIYPVIVLGVTFIVVIMLFTVFIPRFARIFHDMGRELPAMTLVMLKAGEVFKTCWWVWPLLVAGIIIFARKLRQGGKLKNKWDKFILKIPLVGKLITAVQISRFVRTMAIMLKNHVHLLPAVKIGIRVIENRAIAGTFSKVTDELRGGSKLSAALNKSPYMPPGSIPMIRIAEESGSVGPMLEQIADEAERKLKVTIKRLLAMMEPVIILILAAIVLMVVISIFLAIMEMNAI
ncbi:type II secretion system F family protein [Lentisphaerota bacterium ZTH]|nr:type II secretion system F family protein [Lentisphaerota bacterium]WET06719.1 type II secretion system F family protein [Lentisphaerota bacterium ZTH]